jgi:hypothetical protein
LDNVNEKLKSVIGSGNFKGNIEPIMKLLSSSEGQRLIKSLSPAEKKAIIDRFMSLDKNTAQQSLKNFDPSMLSGMTAQDILNKLR